MHPYILTNGEFTLSTDPARLDFEAVFAFLSTTYWARLRPRHVFEKAVRNSMCFGLYKGDAQVGFARAITDYATFAWLADVYVLPEYRRRGLARWIVQSMMEHPELKGMRRWGLLTEDAQNLYRQCGYTTMRHPEHMMERLQPWGDPGQTGSPGRPKDVV